MSDPTTKINSMFGRVGAEHLKWCVGQAPQWDHLNSLIFYITMSVSDSDQLYMDLEIAYDGLLKFVYLI